MRKISKTIAALSLLAPASAYPIGIGDIKLHSSLNEKLNAEIALTLDPGENLGDIRVKLAPIEKFDKSGIPWNHFLTKIKFEPVAKNSNLVVVKLTTNETTTEPFLDFLLEVSSLEGSQYREFTVLIDPPTSYQQPLAPATALPAIAAKQSNSPRWTEPERPRERVSRPTSRHVTAAVEQPGALRVKRNDTLSKIASRVNSYSDVSDQQMAIALFQANPQAFYKNNINALSAGSYLNVPEKETVLRLSRQQAGAEFKRQNDSWQGGVEAESSIPVQPAEEAKLTLAAPTETEVAQQAKATVATEAQQASKSAAAPSSQAQQETVQVQDRVRTLEEKLAELEKKLALKDAQLAALQSGAAVKPEEAAPPQPQAEAPAAQQPETAAPAQPVPATQPEAQAPAQAPEAIAPAQPAETIQPTPAPAPAAPAQQPEAAAPPAPVQPAAPAQTPVAPPQPVATPQPAAQPVQTAETPVLTYTVLGGLGVGLLGMFGWLYMRRRQIEQEQSRESMFASSSQISLPSTDDELLVPNVLDETQNFGVSGGSASTSSFLNDFGSEFTFFDTDQSEVDPVSEADVYLAYGRYQQAEELIRNAIAEQPERDEYKLKLLEIFFTNNNKQAFENYVKELIDAGKKNDTRFWNRITEMGGEIIPESPLFNNIKLPGSDFFERPTARKEATASEAESVAPAQESVSDVNDAADFSMPAEEPEQPTAQTHDTLAETDEHASAQNATLDFDLTQFQTAASENISDIKEAKAEDEFDSFDFNLDTDTAKLDDIDELALEGDAESLESLDSFDFFAEDQKTAIAKTQETEAKSEVEFEVEDLEKFDFEPLVSETTHEASARLEKAESITENSGFFSLENMDDTPTEDIHSLDFGMDLDLTDMDELETKIDLAKAYIDMGDAAAAREIAEDVLSRGNPEQKREAQAIIDGL